MLSAHSAVRQSNEYDEVRNKAVSRALARNKQHRCCATLVVTSGLREIRPPSVFAVLFFRAARQVAPRTVLSGDAKRVVVGLAQ